jgi:hypothetical protein
MMARGGGGGNLQIEGDERNIKNERERMDDLLFIGRRGEERRRGVRVGSGWLVVKKLIGCGMKNCLECSLLECDWLSFQFNFDSRYNSGRVRSDWLKTVGLNWLQNRIVIIKD